MPSYEYAVLGVAVLTARILGATSRVVLIHFTIDIPWDKRTGLVSSHGRTVSMRCQKEMIKESTGAVLILRASRLPIGAS
jgi:hypothetical protein